MNRFWKGRSLVYKITAIITVLLVIPITLICVFYYQSYRNSLISEADRSMRETAEDCAADISWTGNLGYGAVKVLGNADLDAETEVQTETSSVLPLYLFVNKEYPRKRIRKGSFFGDIFCNREFSNVFQKYQTFSKPDPDYYYIINKRRNMIDYIHVTTHKFKSRKRGKNMLPYYGADENFSLEGKTAIITGGATLVQYGCSATDIIIGLAIGNILATLTFALLCATIAVDTRLTLYTYLQRILGPKMQTVYNLVWGIGFSALAAAGIGISATAIRRVFQVPIQLNWYPTSIKFY